MDNPAGILIDKEVNLRAKVAAVLKKNSCATNLAVDRSEVAKRKDDIAFNSTLKEDLLPEIERITHSLLKVQDLMSAAHLLWSNKKTSRKITTDAVEIINQACMKKFAFGNGKSFSCIMGGLFYFLGFRYNDPKKQREIAIALQITDVSIRSSYKRWLKEFPDLFQDVRAKLSDQEFHRHCCPITRSQ